MKQAIVIINFPDNVPDDEIKKYYQASIYKIDDKGNEELIICNMPLKPLPKAITEYEVKVTFDYDSDYALGWNDCLKEITGED